MKVSFASPTLPESGVAVVCVLDGKVPTPSAKALDEKTGGALSRAMTAGRFGGKRDQTITLLAPPGTELSHVVVVGLGKAEELDDLKLEALGGNLQASLGSCGQATVTVMLDTMEGCPVGPAEAAAHVGLGALLRSYRFDKYVTKDKKANKPTLKRFSVHCEDHVDAKHLFGPMEKVAEGVFLTRDLVSEPANILYPESFAAEVEKLESLDIKVEVLSEKQMKKLGFGALLGVGQGSERESRLVVMRWDGAKNKDDQPIAFVGKGVCFDSGGISIKPSQGMEDMKWDMGGAGVVSGLMMALAGRKAKVNVIGVIGLVENMPSGAAQRPGDIVTSLSGQTIEVLNTDAEGRLVLADALHYTNETFKPKVMIDLATLTGAIIMALGSQYAGLFSNDDDLSTKLTAAGKAVGEELWRLPLNEEYDKQLKSDVADMKNIGGREAGSITAAQFLQRFVGKTPWAHIDIAGVTWSKKDMPTVPKGGTAFGVRLLDRLVREGYEG